MQFDSNLNDFSLKPEDYYEQTRAEMLEFIPDSANKILDIGCGQGHFIKQLKEKHAEVWGLEIDSIAANNAKIFADRILVGDIGNNIPELPDNYFDCIIFNDVLEHLVDPYQVLNDIKPKLSENGVIVASIPNVRYITNLKKLLMDKQWRYEDAGILDKTHLRFFTKNSIEDMFSSLSFDLIKIEGINPFKRWQFTLLNILMMGSLSDARYLQFACVAKPKK